MVPTKIDTILRDHLVQLYYSIGQTDTSSLRRRIKTAFYYLQHASDKNYYTGLFSRLSAYARDIPHGKGERDAFYCLLYEWYLVCPMTCYSLIRACVFMPSPTSSPLGGWRDLRGIANVVYQQGHAVQHPIIQWCVDLLNYQLDIDWNIYCEESPEHVGSNVAKWIPREKPKWEWLFRELAEHWARIHTPYLCVDRSDAKRKIYMNYRKICSQLNRTTVETQLCRREPVRIESVGRAATYRYLRVLHSQDPLATQCRLLHPEFPLKSQGFCGFHYSPGELVRMAVRRTMEEDTLNQLWKSTMDQQRYVYSGVYSRTAYLLPILDTGMSISQTAFYDAVGIALAISECSLVEKRILLMGNNPAWIRVSACGDGFANQVREIVQCGSENTTNYLYKCISSLVWSFAESGMQPEDIEQLCIVCVSDMNITGIPPGRTIHQSVREGFCENGIGAAYMPHMVYWGFVGECSGNLPCEPSDPRTTLISGTSSSGFDLLANMHLKSRRSMTPYESLHQVLSQKRYQIDDAIG